jgi:carbamoyltransferase
MAEYANDYFDMPVKTSPYMQFVAKVRHPKLFPAISHRNHTARVQTLERDQHPKLYRLMECFRRETGCPMLLKTSLNIKGEPLVNTWEDAERFAAKWNIKIF